ncbi:unnamed protein product [Orchesella dallaii]|uniref:Uncharacterized protein n=1 Tax=Orchesella dallaii TaxID=48710 RepID=A0ABP1RNZ0_9HEXA
MTQSTDSLIAGNNFAHVNLRLGSAPSVLMMNSNNTSFMRNSRSRSSLHQNFFRTKRAEPEETENTSSLSQRPTSTSTLIITPAAKQLEELIKTTPIKSSKRSSRRSGLEKAFESVGVPSDMPSLGGKAKLGRAQSLVYNSDPFGRSTLRRNPDPFGIGSGVPTTKNIDDSHWDRIFRKGDNQHGNNNNNPETISSQEESGTSGTSDTAKSRAMSNTSSADSAFSQ